MSHNTAMEPQPIAEENAAAAADVGVSCSAGEPVADNYDDVPLDTAKELARCLADRWTYPILMALQSGPLRFVGLKRALDPITQRMLTLSLRKLQRLDLLYREDAHGHGQHVLYGLTPFGHALVDRLADFGNWLKAARQSLDTAARR